MTTSNPGNEGRRRGDDVPRDATGLLVVDEAVAIVSVAEWRKMLAALDDHEGGRSTRPLLAC